MHRSGFTFQDCSKFTGLREEFVEELTKKHSDIPLLNQPH